MSDVFSSISFGQMFPSAGVPSNMSAAQASSGYAGPAAYSQNYLNNLFANIKASEQDTANRITSSATALAANTPNTFNMSNAGSGMTLAQMYQPWLTPSGGANNITAGGDYNPYSGGSLPPSTSYMSYPTGGNYYPAVSAPLPGTPRLDMSRVFDVPSMDRFATGMFGGSAGDWKPQIDFSRIFNPQTSGGDGGVGRGTLLSGDPFPGGSTVPGAIDWGGLFGGRGGGSSVRADPVPGTPTPGGPGTPITVPQLPARDETRPPSGGPGATPGGTSVFDTGAPPITGVGGGGPLGGGGGVGGLGQGSAMGAPYTAPADPAQGIPQLSPKAVTEPYNPYYGVTSPYSPRSGGQVTNPQALENQPQEFFDNLLGGAPAAGYGGAFTPPGSQPDTTGGAVTPGGGLPAADLSEQARARLAELMTSKEPGPDEVFAGDKPVPTEGQPAVPPIETAPAPTDPYAALPGAIPLPFARPAEAPTERVPLPAARPADADAPRPSAAIFPAARLAPNGQEPELFVVHHTGGGSSPEAIVNSWRTERPGVGTQYIMDRNGVIHDTANEYGYRGTSHAKDLEMPGSGISTSEQGTSNRSIVGMEIMADNEKDVTPAQLQALQEFAQARYPNTPFYGHGEISTNRANDEGSRGVQAILQSRPPAFNFDWTNAPIPGPPNGPAESPATQAYPGADAPRPPADIPATAADVVPLPAARPAAANIAQANSLLDTTVGNLVQKNSPSDVGRVPSSIASQTLREALGNTITGGLIRSGIEPYLPKLGVTSAEFDKAYAQGRASPSRFGGDFGGMGGELPSAGSFTPFEGFRQSPDFENRANEQLGRDQLAELQTQATGYEPGPEVAPTPLGNALGLGDLPVSQAGQALNTAQPLGAGGNIWGDVPLSTPAAAAPTGSDAYNPLISQRSGYADSIRDDPSKSLQLAARLYSEDQNSPVTRQAILEAMLNRLQATGQDPLNLGYYPGNTQQYDAALAKLSSDNDLLNQVYQEMEGPFGGSNTANYATDWASAAKADEERRYTTPTWTSPTNEQFFRKDINNPFTGSGIAAKNQRWFESVTSPFPR